MSEEKQPIFQCASSNCVNQPFYTCQKSQFLGVFCKKKNKNAKIVLTMTYIDGVVVPWKPDGILNLLKAYMVLLLLLWKNFVVDIPNNIYYSASSINRRPCGSIFLREFQLEEVNKKSVCKKNQPKHFWLNAVEMSKMF